MNKVQKIGNIDSDSSHTYKIDLPSRFEKLLVLENVDHSSPDCHHAGESPHANCIVCSMILEDDELLSLFKHSFDEGFSDITPENRLLEEPLREKLHVWLLHKVGEDGKGLHVLDNKGQSVLHLAAALGYNWAIKPIIAAGVGINFRDLHGWTALHWAACFGRGKTVVTLIALDASPRALTDPTHEFPSGRTPAVLASQNGFKKIAGFLQIQTSMKDSPSVVRNAIEAAAQIFQVFRVQSFHRKELIDYGNENCKVSNEDALTLISVKSNKSGQHGMPIHAAAIKIQNKFRGWKGRKGFLSIRQQIIKIQAHIRGHQGGNIIGSSSGPWEFLKKSYYVGDEKEVAYEVFFPNNCSMAEVAAKIKSSMTMILISCN